MGTPDPGLGRSSIASRLQAAAWRDHASRDERHVIVLCGSADEFIRCAKDVIDERACRKATRRGDGTNEALFAPLVAGGVHRFADAVGEEDEDVALFERDMSFAIG